MSVRAMVKFSRARFDRALAQRGLTVRRFNELSGVSRVTIAKVRRGDEISEGTARKIAKALDETPVVSRPAKGLRQ